METSIIIGSNKLTLEEYNKIVIEKYSVIISEDAIQRVNESRKFIEQSLNSGEKIYGVTTGFGSLSREIIPANKVELLQYNLIITHAIGVGKPSSHTVVRSMMLLRILCILNGNSGVRLETLNKLIECLNKNFIPLIPEQGTVGASGDLAPLSHMVCGMMGVGKAYDFQEEKYIDSITVLKKLNIEPLNNLQAKEGLALNNGTQFITSNLLVAYNKMVAAFKFANICSAVTMQALRATHKCLDHKIHESRPHYGQIKVAEIILDYIDPNNSDISKTYDTSKVQDAYSLRCIPQIHGVVLDYMNSIENTLLIEMNSSTDNPHIFSKDNVVLSGGNFHGMPIAAAADILALQSSYLSNVSERRLDRILNKSKNGFLPSFLANDSGVESGLMIVQYGAAGIAAENRHLALPNSTNNISTCEGFEDIVSMGGWSSQKAVISVDNLLKVLSYELYAGYHAFKFTPEKSSPKIMNLLSYLETFIPVLHKDRYMATEIEEIYNRIPIILSFF